MDENLKKIWQKRIERTMENLKKNNMDAYYAEKASDVVPIVESLVAEGSIVASGGSVSLEQSGVAALLRSGRYEYLDRLAPGADSDKVYRQSFFADAYFCSSNAVTEKGELYNVDGRSNRVAAIAFGPKSVIMVVGYNKIVKNIDEAIERVKKFAAPANTVRLSCNTYCHEKGECLGNGGEICSGCGSDERICCNYLISAKQREKGRIKVIIVGEELGF